MRSSQPILVAVDAGDGADEAVMQADARARDASCALIVCTTFPDPVQLETLFPRLSFDVDVAAARDVIAAAVRVRVVALTRRPAESIEVRVLAGQPHVAIIHEAERLGARLLVLGARSRLGMLASLLGTVAERTVRYASCPVLVARPRALTGHVVVATDFSDPATPALAAGIEEARRVGGRLTAIHCIDLAQLDWSASFTPTPGWVELVRASQASLLQDAEARLRAALSAMDATGDVLAVTGDPPTAIVDAATSLGAEVVIVGTSGRTGLRRVTLGSVAEGVVRNAPTSVMVVRLASDAD